MHLNCKIIFYILYLAATVCKGYTGVDHIFTPRAIGPFSLKILEQKLLAFFTIRIR